MPNAGRRGPGSATKKGRPGRVGGGTPSRSAKSGRYTPPVPRSVKVSPKWMGLLILGLLLLGALVIVLNYFDVLPASPTDWYLLVGILMIAAGFIVATRYR
jgi:Cell division protein CrgA